MGTRNLGQQQQNNYPSQQQMQMQMQRQMGNFQPPQQQIIDQAPTREQIENFQRAQREQDQQQQMTGRSNTSLQDVNAARNALGMGNLPQDGRKQMPSQGPQPMGGKGIGPQAIQAMQAQQGQPGARMFKATYSSRFFHAF
jgi:hypothetical protein